MYEILKNHKAYKYATQVVNEEIVSGKYIKIQCQRFLDDLENEECKYFIDEDDLTLITNLTKLINMSTGLKVGIPAHDALAGFQWFFLVNALCWKHKDNPKKRRYEKSVLLIARKSGKSFLVGLIFIILLLMEPEFSEFYSVAPDRELSGIVKKELEQMIACSPAIEKHFTTLRSEVRCNINKSKFTPLACSDNRMDGRLATVFVADEVGALRNRYPISAMESSQMNLVNRTGILISTAYESLQNPMTEEAAYCEKVLNGVIDDDSIFCMLYKPDNPNDWLSDEALLQANPLALELPENLEQLKKQRKKAIEMPSEQKNFKTKHMNIFVDGAESEVYIATEDFKKCVMSEQEYDWTGRDVYIGVDLSMTTDNTAVAMVTYDRDMDKYVSKVWGFIPCESVINKSKLENVPYDYFMRKGWVHACGDRVISHMYVEEFVANLPKEYGVNVLGICYDRYNCISSANKWEYMGFTTIEIRQHSSVMHPATKLLKECVLKDRFRYIENKMYEINISNCRETLDTNLNGYVNKRKSTGKIDLVVATLNAMVLWDKDVEQNDKNVYETQNRESGFLII